MAKAKDCPYLAETLEALWLDNYGPQRDALITHDWDWPPDLSAKQLELLEHQAQMLTPEDRVLLVAGEHDEMIRMVQACRCNALNTFIEEVFDGKYYNYFDKGNWRTQCIIVQDPSS